VSPGRRGVATGAAGGRPSRNPSALVDTIVIELGNARLQDVSDRLSAARV
jgi:hypothetical protein